LWNFLIFLPWPTARKGFYLCIQKRIQSSMKLKVQLNHSCSVGVGVTIFKSKYNFTFEENKMFVLNCEIIVLYRIQKYVFRFSTFQRILFFKLVPVYFNIHLCNHYGLTFLGESWACWGEWVSVFLNLVKKNF
jgi:hypothetical protein